MQFPVTPINDGCRLHIKVQPRASRDAVGELLDGEIKIHIQAPPVDSAANQSLLRFLSKKLVCPKRDIRIVRGEKSRHKVVEVTGVAAENVIQQLGL